MDNLLEKFLGISWSIHSKHTNNTKEKFRLEFLMEILLETNTVFTRIFLMELRHFFGFFHKVINVNLHWKSSKVIFPMEFFFSVYQLHLSISLMV
jgi:hypothetical protein